MQKLFWTQLPCGQIRCFASKRQAKKWGRANSPIFMLWAEGK